MFKKLQDPDAFFERINKFFLNPNFKFPLSRLEYWQKRPFARIKARFIFRSLFIVIRRRLLRHLKDDQLREEYRRRIREIQKQRKDPGIWFLYIVKCAIHYHYYTMANQKDIRPHQWRDYSY